MLLKNEMLAFGGSKDRKKILDNIADGELDPLFYLEKLIQS